MSLVAGAVFEEVGPQNLYQGAAYNICHDGRGDPK